MLTPLCGSAEAGRGRRPRLDLPRRPSFFLPSSAQFVLCRGRLKRAWPWPPAHQPPPSRSPRLPVNRHIVNFKLFILRRTDGGTDMGHSVLQLNIPVTLRKDFFPFLFPGPMGTNTARPMKSIEKELVPIRRSRGPTAEAGMEDGPKATSRPAVRPLLQSRRPLIAPLPSGVRPSVPAPAQSGLYLTTSIHSPKVAFYAPRP